MALEEKVIAADRIEILEDGSLQIREATIILRDGEPDPTYPAKYHRYVLHPGDDLSGRDARIAAVAEAAWTPEVIAAWQAAREAHMLPAGGSSG